MTIIHYTSDSIPFHNKSTSGAAFIATVYDELGEKAIRLLSPLGLLEQNIRIEACTPSPEEAIGDPEATISPSRKVKNA